MCPSCCILREGNDPADTDRVTYSSLLTEVCRVASYLKARGVSKGDRVAIYMPMIKELVVAMLAVARIGAVHNIVVSWEDLAGAQHRGEFPGNNTVVR